MKTACSILASLKGYSSSKCPFSSTLNLQSADSKKGLLNIAHNYVGSRECEQMCTKTALTSVPQPYPTIIPWSSPLTNSASLSSLELLSEHVSSCQTDQVYPEEAEGHDMRAPGGGVTGAVAGGDAAPVKHDRHIEGALGLSHCLWRDDRGTQVEPCTPKVQVNKGCTNWLG